MSIVAIHDRIMDAAKIESAQILLPSGSRGKQNLRTRLLVGSGYLPGRDGCPLGRSGRPLRRRLSGSCGSLSGPGSRLELGSSARGSKSGAIGSLSGPDSVSRLISRLRPGSLSTRRGCPSGGLV